MPLLVSFVRSSSQGGVSVGNQVVQSEVDFLLANPYTAILSSRHVDDNEAARFNVITKAPEQASTKDILAGIEKVADDIIAKKSHKKKKDA